MKKYYYDFHVHSCLSPCADMDMYPSNICGMAHISGLNIVALTDHNSSKNCPSFVKAAKQYGLIPVCGMELTTSEEIHVVCLFRTLEESLVFDEYVEDHIMKIPDRKGIYNPENVVTEDDEIIETIPYILSLATDISVDEVFDLVESYNGIAFPAHVDKPSNSVTAMLGTIPDYLHYSAIEFFDENRIDEYKEKYPFINELPILVDSDAHSLGLIRDASRFIELDEGSDEEVIDQLFDYFGGIRR